MNYIDYVFLSTGIWTSFAVILAFVNGFSFIFFYMSGEDLPEDTVRSTGTIRELFGPCLSLLLSPHVWHSKDDIIMSLVIIMLAGWIIIYAWPVLLLWVMTVGISRRIRERNRRPILAAQELGYGSED